MTAQKKESLTARLVHDEGAWLKSLGEIGDLARMILELKAQVANLERKLCEHEAHTHK